MSSLTHEKAAAILSESDDLASLTEAVAFLAEDPATKPEELLPAMDHPGIVAEHAAIALHKMTDVPWDKDGQPITSRGFWNRRVLDIVADDFLRTLDQRGRELHALVDRITQRVADIPPEDTSGKKPDVKHLKTTPTA